MSLALWSFVLMSTEIVVFFTASLIMNIPFSLLVSNTIEYGIVIIPILQKMLSYALIIFVYKPLKIQSINNYFSVHIISFIIVSFIILLNVVFLFKEVSFNRPITNTFITYFALSIVIYFFAVLYLFYKLIRITEEKEEIRIISLHYKHQSDFSNKIEILSAHLSELNHDYRHHLQTLNSMINKENNNCETNKYYKNLIEQYDDINFGFIKNYPAISISLMEKKQLAKKSGINFNYEVPSELHISITEVDLNIILSNLLENAFECVVKLENNKYVNFNMWVIKNNLFIQVENYFESIMPNNNFLFISTKKDRLLHGYGLKSVKRIIENLDGYIQIKTDNNKFCVEITIPT